MMEQKIDPQHRFSNTCSNINSNYTCRIVFPENQSGAIGTGKLLKGHKCNEKMKKILFLNHFFNMMEQKNFAQPKFLTSCFYLLSIYFCNFSEKSVGCK